MTSSLRSFAFPAKVREFRPGILAGLAGVAALSLIFYPVPLWLFAKFGLLGAFVGLLWSLRIDVLDCVGILIMLIAVPGFMPSAQELASGNGFAWQWRWEWQAPILAWGAASLIGLVAHFLYKWYEMREGQTTS